jgi:hypothetical protein
MKRILLSILFILTLSAQAWGSTYYMNPAGSDTSPYDTWAKGANIFSHVYNQSGGPHTVYIAPGTYTTQLYIGHANQIGKSYIGVSSAGVTAGCAGADCLKYPATMDILKNHLGPIINTSASASAVAVGDVVTGVNIANLEMTTGGLGATRCGVQMVVSGADLTGTNLYIHNTGSNLVQVTAGTLTLKYCNGDSSGQITSTAHALSVQGGTYNGYFNEWVTTGNLPLTQNGGLFVSSGSSTSISEIYLGSTGPTLYQIGGTVNLINTILGPSWTYNQYTINNATGTTNLVNNILVPNAITNRLISNTAAIDTNNIKTSHPFWTHRQRGGILTLDVDDFAIYANSLIPVFKTKGVKGTFFHNIVNSEWAPVIQFGLPSQLSLAQSVYSDGTFEFMAHSKTHPPLISTHGLHIVYVGGESSPTAEFDGVIITLDTATHADKVTYSITPASVSHPNASSKLLSGVANALTVPGKWSVTISSTGGESAVLKYYVEASSLSILSPTGIGAGIDMDLELSTPATAGFFYNEMTAIIPYMDTYFPGWADLYNTKIFAPPGGTNNATVNAAIKTAGYDGNRNDASGTILNPLQSVNIYNQGFIDLTLQLGATTQSGTVSVVEGDATLTGSGTSFLSTLSGTAGAAGNIVVVGSTSTTPFDIGQTFYVSAITDNTHATLTTEATITQNSAPYTIYAADSTIKRNIRAICEYVEEGGAMLSLLSHYTSAATPYHWGLIIDVIREFPAIQIMTVAQATNYIKTSGNWATVDGIVYTRTWADQSNYHLLPSSPAINAGVNPCTSVGVPLACCTGSGTSSGCTDYAGNPVPRGSGWDIGAYEYQPQGGRGGFGRFNFKFRH